MIDNLSFSTALASAIQTATGITTITEGSTETVDGEFSDVLILTLGSSTEAVPTNATYRLDYRLGYVTQPETYTEEDLVARRAEVYQDVYDYIDGLDRYEELGDGVILQAEISPWEVNYDGTAIAYSIPINMVVQL